MKAQVLAEWRGLPEVPFTKDTSRPVGPLVNALMKELGLGGRMTEEEIIAAWHEIVGDFLSKHSTPTRLFEGILYVRVLQSSMQFELERTWKSEILRKLKARFGRSIRDVRFKMG
jgi:hypothetical protein